MVQFDARVPSALTSGGRFFRISVPRLADHPEDAPMLLEDLLHQRIGAQVRLSEDARRYLATKPWTADVSELLQIADRLAFQRAASELPDIVEPIHLGAPVVSPGPRGTPPPPVTPIPEDDVKPGTLSEMMAEFELRVLKRTLEEVHGNKSAAARKLGISRSYLIQKVQDYGLDGTDPGWTWKRHRAKAS